MSSIRNTPSGHRRPGTRAQRGFGLVEMMVALTLGLLVVGAGTVMFIGTRQANNTSESLSRIQESVRTSYDLMAREVREAGGTPCDAQLLVADVLNNAQGAAPVWTATWNEPVLGFDGATEFPGGSFGVAATTRVAGTQALMVRYGTPVDGLAVTGHDVGNAKFTTNIVNHGLTTGELLMVCNYRQAAIFQASAITALDGSVFHAVTAALPGNCSKGLGIPTVCTAVGTAYQFAPGAKLGRFVAAAWYIGNNGRPETGGRSLYRVTRNGVEEVAEGVRDMQLTYLVAGSSNYVAAAAVANWSQVMAVRFDLSFESPDAGTSTTNAARITRPVGFTINLRNLQP